MTTATHPNAGSAATPLAKTARRVAWIAGAAFFLAFGILEGMNHGLGAWLALAAGMVAPDLSFLLGGPAEGERLQPGQLSRRTVPFYNAVHRALVPFALLLAYTFTPIKSPALFTFLLGWLLHIAVDRVAGYNLRTEDGFIRG